VTLLVVTALLSLSFARLLNVDRGFSADGVLAVEVALPASRYAETPARLSAPTGCWPRFTPCPASTGSPRRPCCRSPARASQLRRAGREHAAGRRSPTANFRFVAPEFPTLGVAIRRGRTFTDEERAPDRPTPALISSRPRRGVAGQDPVGKRFMRGGNPDEQSFEVVGVVADARLTRSSGRRR
jgi:putative ABC transport system permease protein